MDVYIVRHGETEWNKEEIFRGRKDIPLNERGRAQAEGAGRYFKGMPVRRILSSPLSRALQTADAIGKSTGVPVEAMDQFTDFDFGIWEGLPLREVEARFPSDLAIWRESPEKLRVSGGETLDIVRERVVSGLDGIGQTDGPVVIATHRVICKVLVLACLGIESRHFWRMKFDPCSITLLDGRAGRFTLVFSNDTCHLKEGPPQGGYRDF